MPIRTILCKFDDKWKCSFARMDARTKVWKEGFFLAKVQSERRGTRVLAKSSVHGGRAHCTIRSLFDTTNISRNNK